MATKADLALLKTDLDLLRTDLEDRFEVFELRLMAHVDRSLRQQTQWVVGGLGAMALSMLGVVVSILTLG